MVLVENDMVEIVSEEEEEEEVVPLPTDKYKPQSLDKMIMLVALLVEKSRGPDHTLRLSPPDYSVIAGVKGFPFLFQQIKDCINLHQTRNLIFSLCRWNERLASHIVAMIFSAINKFSDVSQPFFKLLTLLVEVTTVGPPGLPCFTDLVLSRMLEVMEVTPQNALDWLSVQVPRNKIAHTWVMTGLENWLQHYLLAHNNQRVRSVAAYLVVALVPSTQFRQCYRAARPHKEVVLPPEAHCTLHTVYTILLRLLKSARLYTDIQHHGSTKLSAYFTLLNYFAISRTEKLMFGPYLLDLWQLFHPKLSEPSIPVHHNKQALLMFWYHVCTDCPENVQLILQNAHIIKNIAFNYILADHEDQDIVLFNRSMLPAYYGLLRLCCQQSRTFTRQLATHQNLTWAFKNITPHPTQYAIAVEELFKLMALFAAKYPDSTEHEIAEINNFRKQTLQLYIQFLDGRSSWATLISAFRILVENDEDRGFVLYNGGLQMCFEAFNTLHVMYHEATACHVSGDLLELLTILVDLIKCLRSYRETKDVRGVFLGCKDWMDVVRKLVTLLNTYNPQDMRNLCIDLLKEFVLLLPTEVLGVVIPVLTHCHAAFQDSTNAMPMGPYFPRRGHKLPPVGLKASGRPVRPMVQMNVPHNQLDVAKGVDPEYDQALHQFYAPYHSFIDVMCRLAINNNCMTENLVNLSAMIGFEAVPLHLTFFPKLWLDIFQAQNVDRKYITMLTNSNYFVDYVESVLLDERLSLNINIIYDFLVTYFPKVAPQVLSDHTCQLMESLVTSLGKSVPTSDLTTCAYKLNGDIRALSLVYSVELPVVPPPDLIHILNKLHSKINDDSEESPNKKRKIEEDKSESKQSEVEETSQCSNKCEEEKAGCSKEKEDSVVINEDSVTNSPEVDWLERLQMTVSSLISALQQKNAREETT